MPSGAFYEGLAGLVGGGIGGFQGMRGMQMESEKIAQSAREAENLNQYRLSTLAINREQLQQTADYHRGLLEHNKDIRQMTRDDQKERAGREARELDLRFGRGKMNEKMDSGMLGQYVPQGIADLMTPTYGEAAEQGIIGTDEIPGIGLEWAQHLESVRHNREAEETAKISKGLATPAEIERIRRRMVALEGIRGLLPEIGAQYPGSIAPAGPGLIGVGGVSRPPFEPGTEMGLPPMDLTGILETLQETRDIESLSPEQQQLAYKVRGLGIPKGGFYDVVRMIQGRTQSPTHTNAPGSSSMRAGGPEAQGPGIYGEGMQEGQAIDLFGQATEKFGAGQLEEFTPDEMNAIEHILTYFPPDSREAKLARKLIGQMESYFNSPAFQEGWMYRNPQGQKVESPYGPMMKIGGGI